MPGKPFRMRVRMKDGNPSEHNKLKGRLVAHIDLFDTGNRIEFIVCAVKEAHLQQVREKLAAAGLEEIAGDTTVPVLSSPPKASPPPAASRTSRPAANNSPKAIHRDSSQVQGKKPYGFVPLPSSLSTANPVWHDGTSSEGKYSGEIRFELETLTPLLVGWERGRQNEGDWPVPANWQGSVPEKSVLCPLRAPWGDKPVILPADSLKGLLRHELGALLAAPMERVAERSYSYRPNMRFAPQGDLIARIARVPDGGTVTQPLNGRQVRVPTRLELLPANLRYDKRREAGNNYYRFDDPGNTYRGGMGAGQLLNSTRRLHASLRTVPEEPVATVTVPESVQEGYVATLRHLIDPKHGHFSERHPQASTHGSEARERILDAAATVVFSPGDLVWVEWDTEKKCIVSLGWHYYYRWAYVDTIRKRRGADPRAGLFPLLEELALIDDAPGKLSPVRRLFGYTGEGEGSAKIGRKDHAQLMGRVSVNAALELIEEGESDNQRFLAATFLKELGMPRPSAVEHYIQQPPAPLRPDKATLATYGDARGYDTPGELAGRKFYLDRPDVGPSSWEDRSPENRGNTRSVLAINASKPHRRFRFTVRFRDLEANELAAIMVALCPHQFSVPLGGNHADGYCSKLGYARPLGWGSVRITAKALLLLKSDAGKLHLDDSIPPAEWIEQHRCAWPKLKDWLAVHRRRHPDAGDYPREGGNIYSYHTHLRGEHVKNRRYRRDRSR